MARKVKKLNRKMKKSIRRTIASVMLITSLVVAAIPVPENVASVDSSEVVDGDESTVPPTVTPVDLTYKEPNPKDLDFNDPNAPDLDVSGDDAGAKKAYTILKLSDNQWWYDWQFKFVDNGTQGGIVSKYNSQFKSEKVVMPVNVTAEYVLVKEKDDDLPTDTKNSLPSYDGFFTASKLAEENKITNITKDGAVEGLPNDAPAFFEKYFPTDLENLKAKYKAYYIELDRWTSGNRPVKPDDLVRKTEELPSEQRRMFYCDVNLKDKYGTGFILEAVINNADKPSGSNNIHTYIPKALDGGKPTSPYRVDNNGFLCGATAQIGAIGNGAFKGIENVDVLEIPREIAYIGDEAFMNSFIKSITLVNIKNIGNRAFKDCTQLKEVDISSATVNIGNEAFRGSGIVDIVFPPTVALIGHGAFANSQSLQSVDFSSITKANSQINDYAFYECTALNKVDFGDTSMKAITKIGDAAFAVNTGPTGSMTEFVFPTGLGTQASLGSKVLAGRSNLTKVIMPADYGRNDAVTLPIDTFYKCYNLKEVEFPDDGIGSCGGASLPKEVFASVSDKDFIVRGPAVDRLKEKAKPRMTTRETYTSISNRVPYVFKENGVDYYEVSDGKYLLLIDNKGELVSCEVVGGVPPGEGLKLTIPSKVGEYKVVSIAKDAFSKETKDLLETLTIEDDSIAKINDGVFEDCPKLEKVQIGNSVNDIGNRAFANCPKLKEVIFNSPASGNYGAFTIGNEAFATKSSELTFYGDIHQDYEPFKWAVAKDNYMDVASGKRVCYKSLTADAENKFSSPNLTIMYDNSADEIVLLDYPKYNKLDEVNRGNEDEKKYIDERESYFIDKYAGSEYNLKRKEYQDAEAEKKDEKDGPWNTDYFTKENSKNKYSIIKNYEEGGNNEWQTLNPYEAKLVDACLNIEIPKGVTSIDVFGFYGGRDNEVNWITYMREKADPATLEMYTSNQESKSQIAGLFSGNYIDDKKNAPTRSTTNSEFEKVVKGNDYVKTIVLNDVKKLPKYAFDSCEALESVTLGEALTELGTTPFRGCTNTTSVAGNSKYTCTNGILYSKNADDSLTIEECLASRGDLVGEPALNSQFDPDLLKVSNIRESAFEDCVGLRTVTLTDITKLTTIPKKAFKNCVNLTTIDLPETIRTIAEEAFAGDKSIRVKIIGKEVNIATSAFEHNKGVTIISYENSAAERYAKYHDITFEAIGASVKVTFLDYDGTVLKEEKVESGGSATPPSNPKRDNYTFTGWKGTYKEVKEDSVVLAQYNPNANSGSGSGSGGSGSDSNKDDDDDDDNSGNSSSSKSKLYTVIVANGTGGGTYKKGTTVTITANSPSTGKVFDRWETSSVNVSLNDVKKVTTSFKMPGNDVKVTAVYKNEKPDDPSENDSNKNNNTSGNTNTSGSGTGTGSGSGSGSSGSGSSGSGGSSNSNQNNGSSAVVTTPGISNTDKATVTVDGSTDNFVVKISESAEATAAVERALLNEFGSLDNIRYFPMDISLYDSSGVSKIEDTSGLTVNITMPIPDALVTYAGNNKAGAVIGEDTLEKLDAKFKTIDGVSCISFKATHFSPYTVYVDTSNLTASMDDSPKTGDGIHPKWFLSLGLACLSIVLFMKKDKSIKAKLA